MSALLVTASGSGSMSVYGRQLARHLPEVAAHEVDLDGCSAGSFGARAGPSTGLLGDARLVLVLRRAARERVPHLTHHHLARYGPLLARPYVATAHDLIRLADTRGAGHISSPTRRDAWWVRRDADGVRRAAAVIAPSAHTADALQHELGVPAVQVTVVPHGLDHAVFRPPAPSAAPPLPSPYLLFVGSEHPRKGFADLLRALPAVRARVPEVVLVKVGAAGDAEAPFAAERDRLVRALDLEPAVRVVGEVAEAELVRWYGGASALVLPSRAEGFGIPPLEAMACGCPAVVSTAGALPEVAGGAALLVPPRDVPALAAALVRVLTEPGLAADLRARGLCRAAELTWERCARETAAVHATVR